MKIIQSYWSKPSLKNKNINETDRSKGGWLNRKYNYFSWTLSCLKFKEFFDEVELYTDEQGVRFLVDILELPYSKVHVRLDELNKYHSDLWAIGKLYTYALQKEPFLHVDGDVFIWEKFGVDLLASDLIVQNNEAGFDYYQNSYKEISSNFSYIPKEIETYFEKEKYFSGINAGIIGGNDIAFFQKYTSIAFRLIDENIKHLDKINIGLFNNFFEQALFKTLAELESAQIAYLLDHVNDRFDHLVDFTGVPSNTQYVHTVGVYKKRAETGRLLEYRLKAEYPDYYYRIVELLKKNIL